MKFRVWLFASFYFLSSSALLVLNKVAISVIPNASLLLYAQIASTVVIVSVVAVLSGKQVIFLPSVPMAKAYSSVAAVFLATIYSNFKLIHIVGVNPFIVLRCTTPLMVSILDWCFLGRELPSRRSALALCGIFLSGSAYAWPKITSLSHQDGGFQYAGASSGLFWAFFWLSCFTLDMVYIKHIVDSYPCNGYERTIYQNALSLPFLTVILLSPLETSSISSFSPEGTERAQFALLLSCIAGTVLSFTGMSLRSELSATVFTILGIMCKMASSLLNEIFIESEKSIYSLACIFFSILSSAMYRQAPLRAELSSRSQTTV